MVKKTRSIAGFALALFIAAFIFAPVAKADGLPPATRPADCESTKTQQGSIEVHLVPYNCIFLQEPVGGKMGYDLFTVGPCPDTEKLKGCEYKLWGGNQITGDGINGPVQAILSTDEQGNIGLGLFYNYTGLIYKYLSGLIVGISVLFIIVGGVQMTISAGDQTAFDAGKSRIKRAVLGMIFWFVASLFLYTINPTFFAF